uniref:C-type lectin domain-containing protein n=1 Tax=Arion vulgaris TaxID=1028688 RepID=A0A0B6ZT36_9EUPU
MIRVVLLLALSLQCVLSDDGCYNGWAAYEGYCYGFFVEDVSWLLASANCDLFGARLAEIDSKQRETWLSQQLVVKKLPVAWIGLSSRLHPGVWQWTPSNRDVSRYVNWIPGEPNNYGNNEQCVELKSTGGWNDLNCLTARKFICEKKLDTTHIKKG